MGKKRKHLSHEEIWDDSALVDSWNAALQEYQLYHSIHARGERVEDIVKEAKASDLSLTGEEQDAGHTSPNMTNCLPDLGNLEDGEVEDNDGRVDTSVATGATVELVHDREEVLEQQHHVPSPTRQNRAYDTAAPHGIPATLMNGEDESLKNLMMSWYYAGYYTGLYEGHKQYSTKATNGGGSEGVGR
ncbi:MAG: hypothetical protein L6R35_004727 [Caloplaca aegaea]|nr:MAG: hypothetical protein L6R35_004727 [Caloplaca aegaea]